MKNTYYYLYQITKSKESYNSLKLIKSIVSGPMGFIRLFPLKIEGNISDEKILTNYKNKYNKISYPQVLVFILLTVYAILALLINS